MTRDGGLFNVARRAVEGPAAGCPIGASFLGGGNTSCTKLSSTFFAPGFRTGEAVGPAGDIHTTWDALNHRLDLCGVEFTSRLPPRLAPAYARVRPRTPSYALAGASS